ncbi:MAG TPA: hypothetical protein VG796_11965 [Verrucomicrobiales bacterium]|nr:hypothetical protein [Verrucomicrobiales bacterium]
MLRKWADGNGFEILASERREFLRGPFFWTGSGRVVHYVTVRDRSGTVRSGWVRYGGPHFGLLTNEVEVKWKDGR